MRLKRLLKFKKDHKLSTADVALILTCSASTVRRWYTGHPIPEWVERLFVFLDRHKPSEQQKIITELLERKK